MLCHGFPQFRCQPLHGGGGTQSLVVLLRHRPKPLVRRWLLGQDSNERSGGVVSPAQLTDKYVKFTRKHVKGTWPSRAVQSQWKKTETSALRFTGTQHTPIRTPTPERKWTLLWRQPGGVLEREDRWFGRGIKEAIHVKLEKPSSNRGGGLRHFLSPTSNSVLHSLGQNPKHSHRVDTWRLTNRQRGRVSTETRPTSLPTTLRWPSGSLAC